MICVYDWLMLGMILILEISWDRDIKQELMIWFCLKMVILLENIKINQQIYGVPHSGTDENATRTVQER